MKIKTLALCLACASLSAAAHAAWPERPVRLVIPYTPGGSVDTLARLVADEMGRNLSQPIIVENKPGASGIVASQHVARAAPDGYTLLFHASSQVSLPLVDANAKYDALKDFSHIAFIGEVPLVVAVPANSPYKTLRDLQQGARADSRLSWGTSGIATASHLAEELLNRDLGIKMEVVAYRGAAQQLTDIIGGHVAAGVSPVPGAFPYLKAERLRALAVTSPQRLKTLPSVPTAAESGLPGFEFSSWYGLWGPAGLQETVVRDIHAAVHKALSSDAIRKKFDELMVERSDDSPAALRAKVQTESRLVEQLVKDNRIVIQ